MQCNLEANECKCFGCSAPAPEKKQNKTKKRTQSQNVYQRRHNMLIHDNGCLKALGFVTLLP